MKIVIVILTILLALMNITHYVVECDDLGAKLELGKVFTEN